MPSKIRQTRANGEWPDNDWRSGPLLTVRTIYIQFVQGLFSAAPKGNYNWSPLLEETEIVVTDENPINVEAIGKRPAVGFTRGPVQSYTLGQDDLLGYNFETGKKVKSVLIPGTMSINVCSRNDIESESLAWVIAEQLWMHRELLMRAGFFEIGRGFVIGAPSPAGSIVVADSSDEWYVTTVTSPFQFHRTSSFAPLGHYIMNNMNVSFRLQGIPTVPNQPVGDPAAGPPFQLETTAPGVEPPLQPHPLNPAQTVVVRSVDPRRSGLRQPSMGGRTIPIQGNGVEESETPMTGVINTSIKV